MAIYNILCQHELLMTKVLDERNFGIPYSLRNPHDVVTADVTS